MTDPQSLKHVLDQREVGQSHIVRSYPPRTAFQFVPKRGSLAFPIALVHNLNR